VCGICGFLGRPDGIDTRAMLTGLVHRGPDAEGEFRRDTQDGQVYLGHRRLSIIDLSPTGAQPMSTPDGVHTVAYNGEIYNYQALRQELSRRGYQFRGTSDTEVLLYLLREEGVSGLDRLRGMFAISFWDAERRELLLARDPFGIKPLYYVDTAERLVFASEVRALLEGRAAAPRLDPTAVESYLAFGCVMRPHTIIRGIECLAPGGMIQRRVGDRACRVGCHYTFPAARVPQPGTYEEAVERTSATLRRVVGEHMVADVPVGILLSGGIDSSGLVATLRGQDREIDTFSVVFSGEDESLSERAYSSAVARQFGTRHHEVPVRRGVVDAIGEALANQDQPSIDGFNTYVVCKAVRHAGVTVVLSGQGADESFLGYGNHTRFELLLRAGQLLRLPGVQLGFSRLARLPWPAASYPIQKYLAFLGTRGSLGDAYAALRGLFSQPRIEALLGRAIETTARFVNAPPSLADGTDAPSRLSHLERGNYLCEMLLRDGDVMSMAHGLEMRVPYLDRDLVEEVVSLPAKIKLHEGRQKPVLVDSIRPALPRLVVERRKSGFVLPFARWLRHELRGEMTDTLADASALAAVGLEAAAVRELWQTFLGGPASSGWTRPWALFVLARWAQAMRVSL
jgi:asparagine synthase (glutamine-hydrolysing)